MAAMTMDLNPTIQIRSKESKHSTVVEEIEGLIRVYKDGHVERPPIVPCVAPTLPPELGVTSADTIIDKTTNIWARLYVPNSPAAGNTKLPLLLYFHGGGFCVGSAAWSCYHQFLAKLASKSSSVIVSVNYRLAPENPLPAAYDDGLKALIWLRQQEFGGEWWAKKCNFSSVYLGGDSAGGNIAFHVALRRPLDVKIKGAVLIQPFFGGERRTNSEKCGSAAAASAALTLAASDAYWRMCLPTGANREHPWCNPGGVKLKMRFLVCIAEMDILKDRNLEMSASLGMEQVVFNGVGHAFQILNKSLLSETRTLQLISRISDFVNCV